VVRGGEAVSYERGISVPTGAARRIFRGGSHYKGTLHNKPPSRRTPQWDHDWAPMAVLGGGAFSHGRGTPVLKVYDPLEEERAGPGTIQRNVQLAVLE